MQAPPIPRGTDSLGWAVAAAWADVPVAVLLDDTAPVKSTHYMASLRVLKVLGYPWPVADQAAAEAAAARELESAEMGSDPFVRLMLMAEDAAALTASARDRGDAVTAARYAEVEHQVLQAAAFVESAAKATE